MLNPDVQYVAKIKKNDPNEEGKVEYSSLLASCEDFLSEKTCLMYLGERLGVEVDRSTKCHPERSLQEKELNTHGTVPKGSTGKQGCLIKKGRRTFERWFNDAYQQKWVQGAGV